MEADLLLISQELVRRPLEINNYRTISGNGRSQSFGLVNRRCLAPDYSRQCWKRPYLYKLLLDFGEKYVKIPYTSITLNDNYKALKHRDKGNVGESFLVAFGDYQGGALKLWEGEREGLIDIKCKPIVLDFSKTYHSVEEFTGNRYSLVYYTLKARFPYEVPAPSVRLEGTWTFYRGEERVLNGLPHPLKGKKKTFTRVIEDVIMEFN